MSGGDPRAADEWRAAFERVSRTAREAHETSPDLLERRVPACPGWTARELLAHMIGVGHDTLSGDVVDDHNEGWTQGQVDARAGRTTPELLEEWAGFAPDLHAYVRDTDPRPLGDTIIHEQDLRGALESPGARDTEGLASVRATMADQLGERLDGRGPVRLEATDDDWTWQSGDGDPAVVLRAPAYDLTRGLTSRRTVDQLRSWTTAGDVDPYLDDFAGLGPLPEQELPE